MRTNDALNAILELRTIWRERSGRITLADLGIVTRHALRVRGQAALAPERWRSYPGAKLLKREWVWDL